MAQQTLSMLRNRLRTRLDDLSGRGWSDNELNTYLSEGARDVTRRAETNMTDDTVAVSSGTGLITSLPTDILRIYRVEWITSSDRRIALEFRDMNNMDAVWWDHQNLTQSEPMLYCTQGYPPALRVQLYPVPSESGTLKIFYYKIAANLTADSDLVDVPEGWDDMVLDYAEYRAYRRDSDERWESAQRRYNENLYAMIETTRRYVEASGMIQQDAPRIPAWLYGGDW